MKVAKKIALRTGVLILLLIGMNSLYSHFLFEQDLQTYSPIINQIRDIPGNAPILYLGESSNVTSGKLDADKRPISQMLGDYFPSLHVADLTQPAGHAGIFKSMLRAIDPEKDIQTVVITLNLRSFNAEWIYSGLETPLRKSLILLEDRPPLLNRFLLGFKAYPNYSEKERNELIQSAWKHEELHEKGLNFHTMPEWRAYYLKHGVSGSHGKKDTTLTKLGAEFITTYAFRIDPATNPRIQDLNEIIAYAQAQHWNLVFNLLPENTEMAEKLAGGELTRIIRSNRDVLVRYFTAKKVTVVDNLDSVPDRCFLDREWPTEHYNEEGRRIVAGNLAHALKKFHSGTYRNFEPDRNAATHFANDCEGQTIWSNMHTLSSDAAFSGRQSSATGQNAEYSLNFQYPYQFLPKEARNKVFVSMMVNATRFDRNTLIVMDVSKANGTHIWQAKPLSELSQATGKWQRIEHTFDLGAEYTDGELIEIYVYNISKRALYVDDISIRFR